MSIWTMGDMWWAYIACAPIPCDTATRVSMERGPWCEFEASCDAAHTSPVGSTVAYVNVAMSC